MRHEDFVEQSGQEPVEVSVAPLPARCPPPPAARRRSPTAARRPPPPSAPFRQIIHLGNTEIPQELWNDFILNVSGRYNQNTYSLLTNNCNNFSEECAQFLLGRSIPPAILAAPEVVRRSCLGRLVLGFCKLSPLRRTCSLLCAQAVLALSGLLLLASLDADAELSGSGGLGLGLTTCPLATGQDSTVNFAVTVFVLELLYTGFLGQVLVGARVRAQYRRGGECVPGARDAAGFLALGTGVGAGTLTLTTDCSSHSPSRAPTAHSPPRAHRRRWMAWCQKRLAPRPALPDTI